MTLLLAAERPYPFLMADLLVTRPGSGPRDEIPLPSIGMASVNKMLQNHSLFPDRLTYKSCTTKLCSINRYLTIGCAGRAYFASQLVQRLKSQVGPHPIDRHSLLKLVASHTDLISNGIGKLNVMSLGIHSSDPHGYLAWWNCKEARSPAFGTTVAGGRGAALALDMLPLLGEAKIGSVAHSSQEIGRFSTGFSWAGFLGCIEKISSQTFEHAFGGGFEVAAVIDGEVRKANNFNMMCLFIKGVHRTGAGRLKFDLKFPASLSRVFYDEEGNLLIARIELGKSKALKNKMSCARLNLQDYYFIKRFDAEIDLNQALKRHCWDMSMLMEGDYTVYVAAHLTDRLHSFCLAFGVGERAKVHTGKSEKGRWEFVDCPLPFELMENIADTLRL
jgi:hypothetical protein